MTKISEKYDTEENRFLAADVLADWEGDQEEATAELAQLLAEDEPELKGKEDWKASDEPNEAIEEVGRAAGLLIKHAAQSFDYDKLNDDDE
jgi:hypothetical protein